MLARTPTTEAAAVCVDYASGTRIGEKGEYFQIAAYAPTREALVQVMADYMVSHAKHEPWFASNGIIENAQGFVCYGKRYRYDVVGRT